jgi:hypothetical protein
MISECLKKVFGLQFDEFTSPWLWGQRIYVIQFVLLAKDYVIVCKKDDFVQNFVPFFMSPIFPLNLRLSLAGSELIWRQCSMLPKEACLRWRVWQLWLVSAVIPSVMEAVPELSQVFPPRPVHHPKHFAPILPQSPTTTNGDNQVRITSSFCWLGELESFTY